MVGKSLAAFTVRTKFVLTPPRLVLATKIATVADPARSRAGVIVTVRLLPLPPKEKLLKGKRVVFVVKAHTLSKLTGVTPSAIANGIVIGVSSDVALFVIVEI